MISIANLRLIARVRLNEAQALYRNKRYDGAVYLCGYAVEVALKARICRTLKWAGFPESNREFAHYQSFKTHDLDVLLTLSGIEARIRADYGSEWSNGTNNWTPEVCYRPVGSVTQTDALNMISAVRVLVKVI